MGSVKQLSKTMKWTSLAVVFLLSSISIDRVFADDASSASTDGSNDPVISGKVNSLTPPAGQKPMSKKRRKVATPVADAKASADGSADAPATQANLPAPGEEKPEAKAESKPLSKPASKAPAKKVAAPVITSSTYTAQTSEKDPAKDPVKAEVRTSESKVLPKNEEQAQPVRPKAAAAKPAPAKPASSNEAPVVKAAPPAIARPEPSAAANAAPAPIVNVPNLASPVAGATVPLPPRHPIAVPHSPKGGNLANGDSTGAADDEERDMYKTGKLKASDAEKIPESANDLYTVKTDRPIIEGDNKIVGSVKAGQRFTMVLPGERYARVRFGDGRVGYVDNSVIVPTEPVAPIQPAHRVKGVPRPIPSGDQHKLEANCDTCDKARAASPSAIDPKKTKPIADIASRLNRKNRLAGMSGADEEPRRNSHGLRSPSADYVRRMKKAAEYEAVRPRRASSWMRPRLGYGLIGGNRSKGSCFSAVKDVLVDMHLAKVHDHTLDNAYDAHKKGYLKKLGLTNILPDMKSKLGGSLQSLARNAPVGAILVYDQGRAGHIEVKAEDKLFCSDFCTSHPVNEKLARRLIAVYVP